jgi:hypothetical protein
MSPSELPPTKDGVPPRRRDLLPALAAVVVVLLLVALATYTIVAATQHCTPTIC